MGLPLNSMKRYSASHLDCGVRFLFSVKKFFFNYLQASECGCRMWPVGRQLSIPVLYDPPLIIALYINLDQETHISFALLYH